MTPVQQVKIQIDQTILETWDAGESAKKERWKAVAKMTALVAGLVLLAAAAIALIAPTPYALVLIPLFALYLVHCVFPAALYMKKMIPIAKAAQGKQIECQTTIQKLIDCKRLLTEDPSLATALEGKKSAADILNTLEQ